MSISSVHPTLSFVRSFIAYRHVNPLRAPLACPRSSAPWDRWCLTSTSSAKIRHTSSAAYPTGGKKSVPPRLFVPHVASFIPGTMIELPTSEERHVRALRLEDGASVTLFNAARGVADAVLHVEAGRKRAQHAYIAEVIRSVEHERSNGVGVHVVVAMMHNNQRFDQLVEKLTELNVTSISVYADRAVDADRNRVSRWNAVAVAALKQSVRSNMPCIQYVTGWPALMKLIESHRLSFLLCSGGQHFLSENIMQSIRASSGSHDESDIDGGHQDVVVVVGNEKGFSEDEINEMVDRGAQKISLGSLRLRVETAAILATGMLGQILALDGA